MKKLYPIDSKKIQVNYIQENENSCVSLEYPTENPDDLFLNSRYSKSFKMLRDV